MVKINASSRELLLLYQFLIEQYSDTLGGDFFYLYEAQDILHLGISTEQKMEFIRWRERRAKIKQEIYMALSHNDYKTLKDISANPSYTIYTTIVPSHHPLFETLKNI